MTTLGFYHNILNKFGKNLKVPPKKKLFVKVSAVKVSKKPFLKVTPKKKPFGKQLKKPFANVSPKMKPKKPFDGANEKTNPSVY